MSINDLNKTNSIVLPNEFDYKLPTSIPNCQVSEYRCYPVNSQTFNNTLTTGGGVIQFDINSNGDNNFLDTTTTMIRGKVTFTNTGGTATIGTDYAQLLGHGILCLIR